MPAMPRANEAGEPAASSASEVLLRRLPPQSMAKEQEGQAMTHRSTFAIQLFKARVKAGMDQGELAEATGICRTVVCRYEAARSTPEIGNLVLLADALGVTTDMLLGREKS